MAIINDAAAPEKTEVEKEDGYCSFRFRSTGLGKQMLMGEPLKMIVIDDMLIMQVQTTEPVQWVIRAAFTYRGLLRAAKLVLNTAVIKFILLGWMKMKNPKLTDDF